ncbi:tRNA pseudouridine(13) synthase TruD [Novipirellula galeiformis]|uniref:tRNA pseudouridine(13) synthase TruD n=1 Tax=Novipirellula galeiformis TaxID=2528004 RepID=UPI001E2D8124|nr:tRNA pseudouridine(13) synthase TruD [Novipirellula galeiformis]
MLFSKKVSGGGPMMAAREVLEGMNPIHPPRLLGSSLGPALFKSRPEDFQVEEILGFEPSGEGEHCLVWVEKTDRNSNDIATELANKLGIRKRLVSHCGLKDRNAVTRQWFSLHIPGQPSPVAEDLAIEGVRVLKVTRNLRKLHRGSHDGNRFLIRLRECGFSKTAAAERWQAILDRGVPNYFGPQRFGRDGGNIEQARRFMAGELDVRDRTLRGILISAARSFLFNACVAQRVQLGNWETPLDGEVFGFAYNKSLVLPNNLHGDESDRVKNGTLELTAPLWGEGDLLSQREVQTLEQDVVQRFPEMLAGLAQFNLRQERRVIRLKPQSATFDWETDSTLVLSFDLPKGTYATTLLRELADLA